MSTLVHYLHVSRLLCIKLARACLFAGIFFVCLFFGKWVTTFGLHLYDWMFLCVIITQAVLILTEVETRAEVKIILIYHLLGFVMEAFKTHPSIASWSYPDPGMITLLGVPLFSGFMYSAVGSFIFQAWEQLQLRFEHFPSFRWTIPIAIAIYVNFFTHHFIPDIRWILVGLIIGVAYQTKVWFQLEGRRKSMPVLLGLFLTGCAMWLAENIATRGGAWTYPYQQEGWTLVSGQKILARLLLFIVSFVIVSAAKTNFGRQSDELVYRK